MKKKKKAKKSITAVGAVVAAGLTPGIVTGSPLPQSPSTNVELTAADAVSINGEVFDFEDLLALNPNHQINRDQLVVLYGSPQPKQKDKGKKKDKKKDKKKREQEIADSIMQESIRQAEELQRERDRIEALRQDSIRQAMENQTTVYGPPPPRYRNVGPEELRSIAVDDKDEAISLVLDAIMDYCSQMSNPDGPVAILSQNVDIIRKLKMDPSHLKELSEEIENRFAVQLTEDMMKQLGTLERIAKFIVEVAKPIEE